MLITRRALTKTTWPGVWTNTCCGHPRPGESMAAAIARRLDHELGMELDGLECVLPDFAYRATDASGVVENEVCPVFRAQAVHPDDPQLANPDEVLDWKWVAWRDVAEAARLTPFAFSPWAVLQMAQLTGSSQAVPLSDVLIIGAGLAGLAAACHLTGRGYAVTVVEREDVPGGRAGVLIKDGFTFDTGPTVLTMPDLIADALRAVGADLDLLPMRRLDPAYRACFADGSTIMVRSGRDAMRDEIDRTCGSVDAAAFDGFVDWLQRLYAVEMPHFIDANYDSPLGLVRSPRAVAQLLRLNAFGRLGAAVRRRFRDPRLHRLFSFQAMYAGLAPDDALALYAVITYMDSINGVYFPEGGMHALPTALAQAAEKAGTTFCYGDPVTAILRSPDGRVAGVRNRIRDQDRRRCGGLHPRPAHRVRDPAAGPEAAARGPIGAYSPSAVVWHVGVRGVPDPPVAHHNIHFGTQWARGVRRPAEAGHADARSRPGWSPCPRWTSRRPLRPDRRRCTCSSRCPTSRARSTGAPRQARCGSDCTDSWPSRDIRATSWSRR